MERSFKQLNELRLLKILINLCHLQIRKILPIFRMRAVFVYKYQSVFLKRLKWLIFLGNVVIPSTVALLDTREE
jgi:hypothetical protein